VSLLSTSSGPTGDYAALGVWRADRLACAESAPAWPTGQPALDAELPGGGWPATGLTELLLSATGIGELRLLAPALRAVDGELLWVAPPALPYAPALQVLGLARLVCLTPGSATDAAWAAEQALRAGCCAAVLWWGDAPLPMLRRLHLAAAACPLFALRPWAAQQQSSPAPLRLVCTPAPQGRLAVRVCKRRGPPMAAAIELALPLPVAFKEHPIAHALACRAPATLAA
jgi:protein ImuA